MSSTTARSHAMKPVTPRERRPEIEGLRAVAALLVAVFHIWLGRVSGGVDVFFVVAGFLITTTLLGHFDKFGHIKPVFYLSRLARRLLPGALVVLLVVALASTIFLPQNLWAQTFKEVVASALYFENWSLAFDAVDYLAQDAFHTPVQHFWAMSVQGQFYIAWLLLFLIVGIIAARSRVNVRTVALIGLTVVVVSSLSLSIVATYSNQGFTYYNTFARGWEFGIGGLAAILLPRLQLKPAVRWVLGWLGLAAIVACGFVLQVSTVFPGYAALWPVLAAICVLAAGSSGPRFSAGSLLSSKALVWLGGISYGIYLWHWAILTFVNVLNGGERPTFISGFAIIVTSIVLAWLTKKFIETPANRLSGSTLVRPRVISWAAMASAMVAVLLLSSISLGSIPKPSAADDKYMALLSTGSLPCAGASFFNEADYCHPVPANQVSIPADPSMDYAKPYQECRTTPNGLELLKCSYGDPAAETRALIIGNSHAISWFPALAAIAESEGWSLDVYFKSSCVFNSGDREIKADGVAASCIEWNASLQQQLAETEPYDFLLTSYFAAGESFIDASGNPSSSEAVEGFRTAWQPLIDRGTMVWAMHDTPHITQDVFDCYIANLDNVASCDVPTESSSITSDDLITQAATDFDGAMPIDLTRYFCNDDECPLQVGGVSVYRDRHHFTSTYALSLTPYLRQAIGL